MSAAAAAAAASGATRASAARRLGLPIVLFAALALAPLAAEPHQLQLLTRAAIWGLAAMALDLALGFGGMASFGHAAFLGLGAYAVGIPAEHGWTSAAVQWPLAVLLAGGAALAIGALSVRTRGVHFIMITLAFAQMLHFAAASLARYGGDDGLTLWERSDLGPGLDLGDRTAFFYLCLALLGAAYLGLRALVASRFGRALRAAAADERRAASLGFDPARVKLGAFALSGALAGLAGALLANQSEFVSPATMTWARSGELVVMVVLGGAGTLHGPILGALAFLLAETALADLTSHWRLPMGAAIVAAALLARGRGLAGALGR